MDHAGFGGVDVEVNFSEFQQFRDVGFGDDMAFSESGVLDDAGDDAGDVVAEDASDRFADGDDAHVRFCGVAAHFDILLEE